MEEALARSVLDELPARLIGDKAYDPDPLDEKLQKRVWHRVDRAQPARTQTQDPDGRKLRRYRRRGKVERLFRPPSALVEFETC